MAKKRDIQVVPPQNGWAVRKEGASRASSVHDTKAKAMTQGKAQAKRDQVELIAHAEKGRVLPEQLRQGSEPAERQEALRLSVCGSLVETSQLATHAPNFPGRNR
jgi:DNA-binding transcriptional regulator YdaS (Cro superfamily)